MFEVFADTSGWAAFFVAEEAAHVEADRLMKWWKRSGTRVVTTSLILAELASLLESPMRVPRVRQVQYVDQVRAAPWVEVLHVDESLQQDGWNLFKSRMDKTWSLVDCVSFVLMRRRGMLRALTRDHHFEQAGFVRLLA